MQQLLLVDELGALSVHQLLPEVLVLQQLQHVQAVGVPAGGGVTEQRSADRRVYKHHNFILKEKII